MLDNLYSTRLRELAADIPRLGRLSAPDGTATAYSKLCGSTITVDVVVRDGRVADYAHEVKACALAQAASAIVARSIVGSTPEEMHELRETVRRMLKEKGPPPDGKWADIAMLEPVRDLRMRHASTLLVFDAVVEALGNIVSIRNERR